MKWVKISLTVLMLAGVIILSIGCSSSNSATATKPQIATVQRGNILIQVTGTGSLALENKQSLSFGQTGLVTQSVTVKVSDVFVTAGQSVDAGKVLVKADPQNWLDQLTSDQHALDARKVALIQAQTAVVNAQTSLASAQNGVAAAQNSLASAQNGLANAQTNLATAQYNLSVQKDVKAAQDAIDQANTQLQTDQSLSQRALTTGSSDSTYWAALIKQDKDTIATKTKDYNTILTDPANQGVSVTDINTKIAQVNQAQTAVAQAQTNIAQAQTGVPQAQANVAQAQASIIQAQANVVTAQNAVDDAQTTLDRDKASPQEIDAPFKGLITKVNVNVGDIVSRSANLIEIAQPDLFQANILVTERDIMSIKMGGTAAVSFDALSGSNFPAKITQIAPLATVQQGVVNYQVTVELTSLRPTFSTGAVTGTRPSVPGGAGVTGNGSVASSFGGSQSANATGSAAGNGLLAGLAQQSTPLLKDGLSATVNIPVQERDNILLVPNRAISRQGRNSVVQVLNGTTTEARTVQIGISDSTNTEVVSGLNEGEQISISTGASSTTPANRPGAVPGIGGGFRIGG